MHHGKPQSINPVAQRPSIHHNPSISQSDVVNPTAQRPSIHQSVNPSIPSIPVTAPLLGALCACVWPRSAPVWHAAGGAQSAALRIVFSRMEPMMEPFQCISSGLASFSPAAAAAALEAEGFFAGIWKRMAAAASVHVP